MLPNELSVGFIGGGNMGEAMIGAVLRSGVLDAGSVQVSDLHPARLKFLADTYRVQTTSDNVDLFRQSAVVVLAVKPQQMTSVLSEIAGGLDSAPPARTLILSIAAGYPIGKIESLLYGRLPEPRRSELPIIRVMPNTPALVLTGMSGMSLNRYATEHDRRIAVEMLESMGKVIEFEEAQLDAVTALSGSGPAYVFYLAESMIAGGTRTGLNPQDAAALTVQTIKGAVALLEASGETAEALRKKVTSPGGTTEAALTVLEDGSVKDTLIEAIQAAAARAAALSSS